MKLLLLAMVCTALALPAQAHEVVDADWNFTSVHNISGTWYNEEYAGEGFVIDQYNDWDFVITFYSYADDSRMLWLIGVGTLDGGFRAYPESELYLYAGIEGTRYGVGSKEISDSPWVANIMRVTALSCDKLRIEIGYWSRTQMLLTQPVYPDMKLDYEVTRLSPRRDGAYDHCDG